MAAEPEYADAASASAYEASDAHATHGIANAATRAAAFGTAFTDAATAPSVVYATAAADAAAADAATVPTYVREDKAEGTVGRTGLDREPLQ